MIIRKIDLCNFMLFSGTQSFNFSDKINLIVGKNESGKSILSIDAFKYVFFKRIRYKKIENVINCEPGVESGFVNIVTSFSDNNLQFERYLNHKDYKNNLSLRFVDQEFNPVITDSNKSELVISDLESTVNIKNVAIQKYLRSFNIDLDFFELVSVYNPTKNIISDKKKILDLLGVNFDNITTLFDLFHTSFDSDIKSVTKDIINLETKVNTLVKNRLQDDEVEKYKTEATVATAKIIKGREKRKSFSNLISSLNSEKGQYKNKVEQNKTELSRLVKCYSNGVCHACNRPYEDHLKEKMKSEIDERKKLIEKCENKLTNLNQSIRKANDILNEIDEKISNYLEQKNKNEKILSNKDTELETIKELARSKRELLDSMENRFIEFKKVHEKLFSQEMIGVYIKNKIQSFENVYNELYNMITRASVDVKLNLTKYNEPEFGDFMYSGLSTSKKRVVYLILMLALHLFCNIQINFIILDEFFDVFDFDNMNKILDSIFSSGYFKNLQFIITSNNEDLINLSKNSSINLINLIDSTR
jgi:DNA repair exonuclease SbcCD ATPase subunit